ncbi:1-phosphatidylinositol 4,5-bisphosphate phosphodiesterase delta-3-A [Labeo rohita]|uniref:1-phosphatidylinositol 4,5-bisphosphate phosphodiesterase delta-3-A n=1 Tax=Labeo rohita TaxID=84645 RepID=UPI0021E2EE19|nr:1-phosphatidylinositol 4,5-bisphosphate phosphodiesterase delta-3-A [Labeo rohita]XP_050980693.1 1-phosphatidylinositol 4,5-bisphosphate phosphodiesterase delta-3-A [Labeo rohita]XP_050980694.1 1-phosphatidylinositol 4,5-bisphosphate phosphodiesterase delta-3-A [Labeo rohita]XP_050980695.1 1-phosphatidylinositol 4,5-bisphosphate phosphodiesterase delta-3-A [Labeo rohita]
MLRKKNGPGTSQLKPDDPLIKMGVQDDDDVKTMLRGSSMTKVRSPRWKRKRMLKLMNDGVTIWCESNKATNKAKCQQSFSVMEVECVQEGCKSETLRNLATSLPEEQCLTIVFKGGRKSLDLQCDTKEEAQHWVHGIQTLQGRVNNMTQKEKLDNWIYGYLKQADMNHDGKMTYEEVQTLFKMINIELSEENAASLFKKCDKSADGRLEHEEIELFCRELLRRPELDAVFQQYSANGYVLSTVDLREFLKDQGEDHTLVHAQSLILTYELNEWAQKNQFMTPNGFTMYMLSKENDVYNPEHGRVYQDMSRPLSHYFISSSHNTYLTKDQLIGESSVDPYIRALSQGCRCVELDCWDGEKEPIIYHGHTLTSKVPFSEVLKVIAEYAFRTSPYPLILSLENHCCVEQQTIMAQQLRSILGEKLLTKPLNDKALQCLPSPEDLIGKILIKAKKIKVEQESSSSDSSSSDDESKAESKPKARKRDCKLSPELSDLVVYTHSVAFKQFDPCARKPPNEISSFSESDASKLIKESGKLFVRHNSMQLSRIYPSGQRVQSSNYNPQDMWNAGCQMVALNFQTQCEEMDLNRGRFLPNGCCGYFLKPSFMCQSDSEFNPENTGGGPGHNPTLLTIKVISAQQLPKPDKEKLSSIVDPLVWVQTYGAPIDNNTKKTHRIDNNGFNPRWDCTFKFQLHVPELVLVRFKVEDHDYTTKNDFLGQFTLPFTSMRTGYRHVHLLKADGSSMSPSSLFIHVKITPGYSSPAGQVGARNA